MYKFNASGGSRTHKANTGRRILSPVCLPISPQTHDEYIFIITKFQIKSRTFLNFILTVRVGFEPTTLRLTVECSNQLSYRTLRRKQLYNCFFSWLNIYIHFLKYCCPILKLWILNINKNYFTNLYNTLYNTPTRIRT